MIPDEANIIAQLRTGNVHHALLEDNKNYLLVKDDKRLTGPPIAPAGLRHGQDQPWPEAFNDVRVRQAISLAVDRTRCSRPRPPASGR